MPFESKEDEIIHLLRNLNQTLSIQVQQVQVLVSRTRQDLSISEKDLQNFLIMLREMFDGTKESLEAINIAHVLGEIKYIAKEISEIKKEITKIKEDGLKKKIELEFVCDGYELVKKTISYDETEQKINRDDNIRGLLASIEEKEANVLIHAYGLLGIKKETIVKTIAYLGISRESFYNIKHKALMKCRDESRRKLVLGINHDELRKDIGIF